MLLVLVFQALMQNLKTNSKQLKIKWSASLLKVVPVRMLIKLSVHKLDTLVLMKESNVFVCVMPKRSFIKRVLHFFIILSEAHRYNTRNSSFNFRLPKVKEAAFSTFFNRAKLHTGIHFQS